MPFLRNLGKKAQNISYQHLVPIGHLETQNHFQLGIYHQTLTELKLKQHF